MIRDIIKFKYTDSALGLGLTNEIYSGKILKEEDKKVKVKIIKAINLTSDHMNEGEIVYIDKCRIISGYQEESKKIEEGASGLNFRKNQEVKLNIPAGYIFKNDISGTFTIVATYSLRDKYFYVLRDSQGNEIKLYRDEIIDLYEKGYLKESKDYKKESLTFIELKEQIRQWAEQNNLLLTEEEEEEMEMEEEDDLVFVDGIIEYEKLKKKNIPISETEVTFDQNKVKIGLFRDRNANEFIIWYIMK